MNRFDDYYVFRRATIEDCDMIMSFIADEWPKKNHIKNEWYINKRFFRHPIYKYLLWKITDSAQEKGLIVGREIELNGAKFCAL